MKLIAPDYCKQFSCIADKCRHSCCIGWEIDIDDDTYNYYTSLDGQFGKRLADNIVCLESSRHFKLSQNDRCPFLDANNLCGIITELGEDKLCQICADHPRYRNFFSDRIEIGLGLCCEEAARLILTSQEQTRLVLIDSDGIDNPCDESDNNFFALRNLLFDIIQNREYSIKDRIFSLCEVCEIEFLKKTPSEWADIYLNLEILDNSWTDELNSLKNLENVPQYLFSSPEWEISFEQLLIYFIFRHTPDGLYDGRMKKRIAFAIYGLYIICLLCAVKKTASINDFLNIARMYSAEIEYCENNMNKLLNIY